MRRPAKTLFVILLFVWMAGTVRPATAAPPAVLKSTPVVATVNGREIREADLSYTLAVLKSENPDLKTVLKTEQDRKKFRKTLMDQLITKELLLSEAVKLKVPDKEEKIDSIYRQVVKDAGSEKAVMADLKAKGIPKEWFMREIERTVYIQYYVDLKLKPGVRISDADIRAYYEKEKDQFVDQEKVRASHILIKVGRDTSLADRQASKRLIIELLERAKKGESFAKLAREFSDDTATRENGGDLGDVSRGVMVPEFEKAVFALKPGQLSGVVETVFGYHIILCVDRQSARSIGFDQAREDIRAHLTDVALREKLDGYVGKLRKQAKIKMSGAK